MFFPIFLSAQINESDTLNVKASLSITGFYQGGNVETLIFRAKTDLSFKPLKKWVFKNQNSYVYQEFGKNKAKSDVDSSGALVPIAIKVAVTHSAALPLTGIAIAVANTGPATMVELEIVVSSA